MLRPTKSCATASPDFARATKKCSPSKKQSKRWKPAEVDHFASSTASFVSEIDCPLNDVPSHHHAARRAGSPSKPRLVGHQSLRGTSDSLVRSVCEIGPIVGTKA